MRTECVVHQEVGDRIERCLHEAIRLKRTQRYDVVTVADDAQEISLHVRHGDDAVSLFQRWVRL